MELTYIAQARHYADGCMYFTVSIFLHRGHLLLLHRNFPSSDASSMQMATGLLDAMQNYT